MIRLDRVMNSLNTGVPGSISLAIPGIKLAPVHINTWCAPMANAQYRNALRVKRFLMYLDQYTEKQIITDETMMETSRLLWISPIAELM